MKTLDPKTITNAELREGKARVFELLIEPIESDGMRKPRDVSRDDHAKNMDRLAGAVAYLDDTDLARLVDTIQRNAVACVRCGRRETWPSVQSIRAWAHDIKPRPDALSPKVASYMRSAAGVAAWNRSPFQAAALLKYLRRMPSVPTTENGGWVTVENWAEELRERIERAEALARDGRADSSDLDWLEKWSRHRGHIERLVISVEERADEWR